MPLSGRASHFQGTSNVFMPFTEVDSVSESASLPATPGLRHVSTLYYTCLWVSHTSVSHHDTHVFSYQFDERPSSLTHTSSAPLGTGNWPHGSVHQMLPTCLSAQYKVLAMVTVWGQGSQVSGRSQHVKHCAYVYGARIMTLHSLHHPDYRSWCVIVMHHPWHRTVLIHVCNSHRQRHRTVLMCISHRPWHRTVLMCISHAPPMAQNGPDVY